MGRKFDVQHKLLALDFYVRYNCKLKIVENFKVVRKSSPFLYVYS